MGMPLPLPLLAPLLELGNGGFVVIAAAITDAAPDAEADRFEAVVGLSNDTDGVGV